ncbi:MAG: DUF1015 family protein [Bacillota bacterium]
MTIIRPFKAIRPVATHASDVAALPYDVMNTEEAREMVKGNPYSFLHIDKSEIDLPETVDHYSDEVYAKAKSTLEEMKEKKIFMQDDTPKLYIYQLGMDGRTQTGLVVCTSVDEYLDNTIKKHEFTRAEKEADRIRHVDVLNTQTGPIFLAYKEKASISNTIKTWMKDHKPVYDFKSEDAISHRVWVIDNESTIASLVKNFDEVANFYIADGHHRNASAAKVALKRREEKGANFDQNAEFNFYLSVLFPDAELKIMDYNRVVKDLNGLSQADFMKKIEEKCSVSPAEMPITSPEKLHNFHMYIDQKWYVLEMKKELISADPVDGLDVALLQNEILQPILGIGDPRVDTRIDFVGGIRGLSELEKRVDSGEMAVAFAMFPTSMDELMAVADANMVMPPKSTWFEPKLRSGLFLHDLG